MDLDIGLNKKYTGTLLFLSIGFLILGLGLIVLTWQNLRQQQKHVKDQMEITGQAIIRSVEANLYRGIFGNMGHRRLSNEADFTELARDVLEELVARGDVVFIDISSHRGRLFISRDQDIAEEFTPSQDMIEQAKANKWSQITDFMDKQVFILGVPSARTQMMGRSRYGVPDDITSQEPGVIFIALDMASHLSIYSSFKRTIILQTGFTLGAVLLVWFLLLTFVRKREENAKFIQLKTFHSRLMDNMPDGLLSIDQGQVVVAANPAARDILQQGENLIGRNLYEILPEEVGLNLTQGWTQLNFKAKSLEIMILPIRETKEYLILIRDRTRIRELEKDLEHTRDLATLGKFAAGLAHEIRNPLSSLRGFAQYFQQKFSKEDQAHSYAKTMVMESDRLNRVVTDLLYLARPRPLHLTKVDISEVFAEVKDLLQSDLSENKCRIDFDIAHECASVDRDLLKQALINLVLNSLSAIDKEDGQVLLGSALKQDMVEITVQDNGYGMDMEIRNRATEPFFSNKEKGTGLGLAIVYRIVRDHKGKIKIDSQPGQGTKISLLFPLNNGADFDER
ncbi:MAG: nitrogen regulation protein NR(II) [Desulfonatronovibrio sp.]